MKYKFKLIRRTVNLSVTRSHIHGMDARIFTGGEVIALDCLELRYSYSPRSNFASSLESGERHQRAKCFEKKNE